MQAFMLDRSLINETEGESDLETHNNTNETEGTSTTTTNTTTSMSEATLDQLLQMNPALAKFTLRVDKATQKGSVIDVIRMIVGSMSGKRRGAHVPRDTRPRACNDHQVRQWCQPFREDVSP